MIYKVLQSNNLHDLENQVMQKMNEGYTLQGGVGLLQISNIIGESLDNKRPRKVIKEERKII